MDDAETTLSGIAFQILAEGGNRKRLGHGWQIVRRNILCRPL